MPDVIRGLAADIKRLKSKFARKLKIHIAVEPTLKPVAALNPYNASLQTPDSSTDKIVRGYGTFQETKNQGTNEDLGRVVQRRGIVEMHPKYETVMKQAHSVEIGRETGVWKIQGVLRDSAMRMLKVYVQGES